MSEYNLKEVKKKVEQLQMNDRNYIEEIIDDLQNWLFRQETFLIKKEK